VGAPHPSFLRETVSLRRTSLLQSYRRKEYITCRGAPTCGRCDMNRIEGPSHARSTTWQGVVVVHFCARTEASNSHTQVQC
jgi:hypothetical protein